ncbi:hypothetical protein [Lewinella sp. LCG006]|uniref:hypothetical protein n=1 Tax=Lewinella sp. LCG006 TaxID=3231911 RepID=UPI003461482C
MKKLSFLLLPFCLTICVNQCLSQVVQVRIDGVEIKKHDTVYIIIQPLLDNDTLEIVPITSTDNEFTIDHKYATGENILSFEYTNEIFSFEIELEAQKIFIDIKNPKNPSCLLKRRFHSCDASGLSTFGDDCLNYNYCITNYCYLDEGIEGVRLNSALNVPSNYDSFLIDKGDKIRNRAHLLNSANGVWYFHRVASKEQRRSRRIKLNYCGFRDSIFWNYRNKPIAFEGKDYSILANEIGEADFYVCVTDPINYDSIKQVSSCPSLWFVSYGWPQLLIKADNSGQTIFTFRIKRNKMILNQVESDENGYSIRGRRYILKKKSNSNPNK